MLPLPGTCGEKCRVFVKKANTKFKEKNLQVLKMGNFGTSTTDLLKCDTYTLLQELLNTLIPKS